MPAAPLDPTDAWVEALETYVRQARRDHRLPVPPADSVQVQNPQDGSCVTLDAHIRNGRVHALGYKVRACSIAQAATMILARRAQGMDLSALQAMRAGLMAVIVGGDVPDALPELAVFALVRDVPNRHASALLPFQALEQLFSRTDELGGISSGLPAGY